MSAGAFYGAVGLVVAAAIALAIAVMYFLRPRTRALYTVRDERIVRVDFIQ